MTLIKSISGIRGTIGGTPGEALTPIDIVKFTYAYCVKLRERRPKPSGERYRVVVGKDARISGEMVEQLVCGSLIACGVDVIKAGYASTPTTEMAVIFEKADGGIILTASHNPKQWNALKLLNEKGEFLNAAEGAAILECAEQEDFDFADVDSLGTVIEKDFTDAHIDAVLALEAVDVEAVKKAGFKVALDAVNSVGGIIMPKLFERLGVECVKVNCEPTGHFAHNPEPLPANLVELCETVVKEKADLGVSVDPDVDRLALICENGQPFGEEYTLVSVADYILSREKGKKDLATSSNLSSSRALRDVTESYGGKYYAAAVGEVNVTTKMKECGAIIDRRRRKRRSHLPCPSLRTRCHRGRGSLPHEPGIQEDEGIRTAEDISSVLYHQEPHRPFRQVPDRQDPFGNEEDLCFRGHKRHRRSEDLVRKQERMGAPAQVKHGAYHQDLCGIGYQGIRREAGF